MHAAALIASDGSIDWACLPYFDSPAVFLRLLDCQKGGYCAIHVADTVDTSRRYIEGTNILETAFTAKTGCLVMTDFMPLRTSAEPPVASIVRLFRCSSGSIDLSIGVKPTFAFASEKSRIHSRGEDLIVFEGRDHRLLLRAPNIQIREDGSAVASLRLDAGDTKYVTISCSASDVSRR